jgi:putative ABC transport system permease protein
LYLIAFVLAAPLAWYGIDWWLKDYNYKTEIGVGLYLMAGIGCFSYCLANHELSIVQSGIE